MLFSKNDERANERVLYKTKPNMFLGCKKAIYGVVLLAIVFFVSPMIIQFIGEMQVYLISHIRLPLTRYAAIAFFVVILVVILYIIMQLLRWYSIEYTLTDTRIIIKSGILSTKKNYMPYTTIQDVNSSQSFLAKMFNVGTVSAYSAYDNNQLTLENISSPSKVEEIIFSNMMGYRNFQEPPRNFINRGPENRRYPSANIPQNDFVEDEMYYDEYEPITPITRERKSYPRREYEYYPEEFSFQEPPSKKYEYEPYDEDFERTMNRVADNSNEYNVQYDNSPRNFSNEGYYGEVNDNYSQRSDEYYHDPEPQTYYDEVRDNYSQRSDEYYHDYEPQTYYDEEVEETPQKESPQVDEKEDSSETVIRRHFDKFKK